jgi:hypothetical protein
VSIENRLARLEKATSGERERRQEWELRAAEQHAKREAAWAVMQQSMNAEHARLVVEAYAVGAQDIKNPEYHTPGGRLLRRCLDAMSRLEHRYWPYTEIPDEVVLAMPPALAEVYLARDELPLHECESCGFHLPFGCFEACPLCRGRIGYTAYYNRRKAEADTS